MTRESATSRRRRLKLLAIPVAVVSAIAVVATGLVTGPGEAASTAVPNNTAPPTISGTTTEGQTLTANKGTWTGTEPITYSYQWRRCDSDGGSCSNIGGAKDNTYTLKAVDVGNTLRVVVSAKNSEGTRNATSVPTAVVKAGQAPPPSNGCGKVTNGTIQVADITSPAHLLLDQATISPSTVSFSSTNVSPRFHVTACGANVQGALIYVTAVPYNQFSIPNEAQTGADGWVSLDMNRLGGFPATQKQQLLVMFARARKPGEPVLAGISARRLVSFRVVR
jgi:hypothetical protein